MWISEPIRKALLASTLALVLARAGAAPAQPGLGDLVFTVGTTTTNSSGVAWSYVLWQGTTAEMIRGRSYAVYAKTGDAAALTPYSRRGVFAAQTDPLVITVLLNRAINLGESLPDLEDHINALFQKIMPAGTLTLPQKVAAVIGGATADPEHFQNLILLARGHPGMSFCLGIGFGEPLAPASTVTYEVREFDPVKGEDVVVLGRVTVQAGAPPVLPSPGPVVEVPDASPRGDLNVKLRWATSPSLRRLSLLNYGFNVYRMPRAFAEANSYHLTPPSTATLLALTLSQPNNVRRVNHVPVLASRDFDAIDVGNLDPMTGGDPTTYFLNDDNGRYDLGGLPFVNGDQYYYFATARDVLSRDGLVSAGVLVTVCDRMPPKAPKGLRVLNDYSYAGGASKQVLRLDWDQNPEPGPGGTNGPPDATIAYNIYRWDTPREMELLSGVPTNHLIGTVAHVPGQRRGSFTDDGSGAPSIATDAGRTFWYSVRAADDGACGPNLSGNSAPAFGVLRDRVGPAVPSGHIYFQCVKPAVTFLGPVFEQMPRPDPTNYHFLLVTDRKHPGIAWAEFFRVNPADNSLTFITRQHFLGTASEVSYEYVLSRSGGTQGPFVFACRVADLDGRLSDFAIANGFDPPPIGVLLRLPFTADLQFSRGIVGGPAGQQTCDRHVPRPPGTSEITCIDGDLVADVKAKEWKIYRRVDDGPVTLIDHGFFGTNVWQDCAMPANSADLSYFAQYFDENGNASPFKLLGTLKVAPTVTLPVPLLSPIEAAPGSTALNARMTLRWFCPAAPVERFQVCIAADPPGLPAMISSALSSNLGPSNLVVVGQHGPITNNFDCFLTAKPGLAFGPPPQFTVEAQIQKGVKYTVVVMSIAHDGSIGEASNAEEFTWNPVAPVGPKVPWPARGLPLVTNPPLSGVLGAEFLPPAYYTGVGVRIGMVPNIRSISGSKRPYTFSGAFDPASYVFTNTVTGRSLFPVVLYRFQVANAPYPSVSGDVTQVSPMMETIAYQATVNANNSPITVVHDPFVTLISATSNETDTSIYLLDTQPVISGAAYEYLLVRFDPVTREIAEVLPAGTVTIP